MTITLPIVVFTSCFKRIISAENSYRPVVRGYLALGSGNLLPQVGSPAMRPKIAISQLRDIPQQRITTKIGMQLIDWSHWNYNNFSITTIFHTKWSLFVNQGYLLLVEAAYISNVSCPQGYHMISTSFQRCIYPTDFRFLRHLPAWCLVNCGWWDYRSPNGSETSILWV